MFKETWKWLGYYGTALIVGFITAARLQGSSNISWWWCIVPVLLATLVSWCMVTIVGLAVIQARSLPASTRAEYAKRLFNL